MEEHDCIALTFADQVRSHSRRRAPGPVLFLRHLCQQVHDPAKAGTGIQPAPPAAHGDDGYARGSLQEPDHLAVLGLRPVLPGLPAADPYFRRDRRGQAAGGGGRLYIAAGNGRWWMRALCSGCGICVMTCPYEAPHLIEKEVNGVMDRFSEVDAEQVHGLRHVRGSLPDGRHCARRALPMRISCRQVQHQAEQGQSLPGGLYLRLEPARR